MDGQVQMENCNMIDDGEAECSGKEIPTSVGFDNVLRAIGVSSLRYQFFQIGILLTFMIPYGFLTFNYVFIGYEPPHVCAGTNETELLTKYSLLNDTTAKIVYEKCQIRITSNITGHPEDMASTECINGHSYEGGKDMTMKTEWDLVCENEGLGELVPTMFNVGMAIAAIVLSPIPDRFGRKPVVIFLHVIFTVLEISLTFSPSIYILITLKMLSGFMIYHISKLMYVISTEILVTKHREVYAMTTLICWSFCLVILGCTSYGLRSYNWRVTQLVSSLTGILPLVLCYFINESLTWLFATGRHTRALKLIRLACRTNGADFDVAEHAYNTCCLRLRRMEDEKPIGKTMSYVSKYGFLDIIRHPMLLKTTMILCMSLFTVHLTYSGLYLTSATFSVNRFFMFVIMSALECFSAVLFFILLSYIRRRTMVVIFLSLTAICLLVSACLAGLGSSLSKHSASFFIIGKFATDISYNVLWAFLVEHYPTTLRNVGIGIVSCFSYVGGTVSPYLYTLFLKANWAPGTLLGAMCLVTVCCYLLVPETRGRELPTTIEEVECLPRHEKTKKVPKKSRS